MGRYDNSNREAQARQTREAIVRAAIELVREHDSAGLSYADIAQRVGIATRTVYRHFPEADDLLRAAANLTIADFRAEGRTEEDRRTGASVAAFYANLHEFLAADPANYELIYALPTREEGNPDQMLTQAFGEQLAQVPRAHRAAVKGLVLLLLGPEAWKLLHDQFGVAPRRSTRAVLAGIQAMLDRFVEEPGLLDPNEPPPSLFQPSPDESGNAAHSERRKRPRSRKTKR